jgi:hypothetical protein
MNLNGLRAIVNKEEIVPTRHARDFLAGSQEIDDLYKHHVRTYIPLQSGTDEASGVTAFASRFIKQVKDVKAPRGYITADFGYGKTSAGLFVWQKAQDARLVAVPPFKLNRLEDFLDATAGWVAYILSKTVPNLAERAVELYQLFHNRELDSIAKRYGVTLDQAERMYSDRALQLNITPRDIVHFFEQMTSLVLEAGFEGLVVIPDELQQYLDPEIKSGRIDPLVPLFDIITELINQQGKLAFGFLMIITSKELGVINDQRGDLIDRLRGNTLDLRVIYDRDFPARLWRCFAETFEYTDLSDQLVDTLTLESLGQIASRPDLSNGPRTVINAFRRIALRALDSRGNASAYSPIDLVDDFLANQIAFDARKLLQEAASRALATSLIRGNPHLEQAVKLLAAFPVDGANREIQLRFGLLEACTELRASGSPDVVIEIGDRHYPALMLRALDAAQENTDELTLILREFIRNYDSQAANQMQRTVNSFIALLALVFRPEQWTTTSLENRNFARNSEAVFVGTFPEMAKRFPERKVHVSVVGDDESLSTDTRLEGECRLVFVLARHLDLSRQERLDFLGETQTDTSAFAAEFSLNLMLPCFDNLNRATQDQLRRVVDVEDVSVMLVLALHAYLAEAAERDNVSKPLKEMIKRSMSVRLLEGALEVLLNPAVGSAYNVNGGLIIEKIVSDLIDARYGDQYSTLITYKQWRDNLRTYISVLRQLTSFAQKQGFALVEGTKEDIAKKFSTTAATFDAFQARFPALIKIDGDSFPRRREARQSGVFLTRHSLEEVILSSLEGAPTITTREGNTARALKLDEVNGGAADMGYRPDETKFIIEIMQARDLVEVVGGWLQERCRPSVSLDVLTEQVMRFKHDADLLHAAVQQPEIKLVAQRGSKYTTQLKDFCKQQKEAELVALDEQVQSDLRLLQTLVNREINVLGERAQKLHLVELPVDWAETLGTMIRASAFTTSLNQVRLHYGQTLQTWNNEASSFRERLSELLAELPHLELASLQRFTGRVNLLTETHVKLNEQRRVLDRAVQHATAWQSTVNQLHDLLEAIQRQGEAAKDLLAELQEIERTIAHAFETQATDAFAASDRYLQRIAQLERQVAGLASQAERTFTREQEQYRSLFIQKTGTKQEDLWQKIIYSHSNPDGVYSNLYHAVAGQAVDLLDVIAGDIESSQTALFGLRTMSVLSDENSRGAETQLVLLEEQINQSNDDYTKVSATLENSIPNPNRFAAWIEAVSHLQKLMLVINAGVRALRAPAQTSDVAPDEEQLLRDVRELKGTNNILRLRQKMAHKSDNEFWQLLKSMVERQLIEVTLRVQ